MNDLLSETAIEKLVLLFVLTAFMLVFWIFETMWRNDRRWIIPTIILPPVILAFIYNYWEETRGKCFFVGLFIVTLLLLGAVTGFSFVYRVGMILGHVALWPFYVGEYLYLYWQQGRV